ncbi:hypothetical protein IU448_27480 [Nocardia flavorosea]|nr:hypothetical protein [Nocardia flavorosea]MBF6352722.1 hypothetical protein [Nocardia flavorosea]
MNSHRISMRMANFDIGDLPHEAQLALIDRMVDLLIDYDAYRAVGA